MSFTPDGRRQMEHDVGGVDQLRGERLVEDGVDHVAEVRVRLQVVDVVDGAGGEVVDDLHVVTGVEQGLGQVGPDEAGAPGNQNSHVVFTSETPARRR